MKLKLFFSFFITGIVVISCGPKPKPQPNTNTLTQLVIENATDSAVTVWITLGATPGCLQDVSEIPYITDTIAPLVGSFTLAAHSSTPAYAPLNIGFNGNVSFNTQPLNCKTPIFPAGVNIFEFIINNSFQPGAPQETVDISCVAGVSCSLKVYLPQNNNWNAGYNHADVDSIYNLGPDENIGLIGVYPVGCDICTASQSPPVCVPPLCASGCDCQTEPVCNVQRDASQSGGILKVVYLGRI